MSQEEEALSDLTITALPRLASPQVVRKSPHSIFYNCLAFALDDEKRWWQPPTDGYLEPGHHWPDHVPVEDEPSTYFALFEQQGYVTSESHELESGYEKVAVYWSASGGIHAAKQTIDGRWKSKLGDFEDIEHATLEILETDGQHGMYGHVRQIFKRNIGGAR